MSMNKAIHGAVRRDLGRFTSALAGFPDGDRGRAQQLKTAWDNFDLLLTHHHESEDRIAWPALLEVGVKPEVVAALDAEHDAMAAALSAAGVSMTALAASASAQDAAAAHADLVTLDEVTRHHLDHEEAELEPVFLEKASSPEMIEMGKAFGKVSPALGGRFFAWVQDGASPAELDAIHHSVPAPVLKIIGGIWGRGYRKDVAPVWR